MTDLPKKEQLYELIRANPFIAQQDLAEQLGLSRSAVAGYIAGLIRERRLLGRAYVLPGTRPVVCIGAANLDRKLRTLAPLVPGTSNPARQDESFGGVARNIAENLARLGAPVALITAIGGDASGQALLAHAEAAGIDPRGSLKLAAACSGTYTALLDERGEMLLALADMALYDALTPAFMASRAPQRAAAALVVADLNLPLDTIALLLADAAHGGAPLVLVAVSEPKMARLPVDLTGLRLLVVNQGELETRIGAALVNDADFDAAIGTVQAQGAQDVIVTLGARGVICSGAGGIVRVAARPAQIVDVTGAGDAFSAAVCWSLLQDDGDLPLACLRGQKLAAMTLESPQTVCPALAPGCLDDAGHAAAPPPFNVLYQE